MKAEEDIPIVKAKRRLENESRGARGDQLDLLVIGQATIDDIYREGVGLVSFETPGGDSIYSVLGASVWPVRTGIVTRVGMDYPRDKLSNATCNTERTNWSGVKFVDGPSIHDQAYYHEDGRRKYIFNDETLLDSLSPVPEDIPGEMMDTPYIHIAPANVICQLELLRFFVQRGATISLDVESHFFLGREVVLMEMLRLSPIFIPSLEHIQQLSGVESHSPLDLWPWISMCGASLTVVKCGEKGAWVFDAPHNQLWNVGVVPDLQVEDVTGAGDSFCGGFMAGLILSRDPVQAAVYGAVSASFIVESWAAVRPHGYRPALAAARLEQVLKMLPKEPILLP